MRHFILAIIAVGMAFGAGVAQAAAYGTAGCGLGSIVLGKSKGIMQTFAATLNGSSYSQSGGITSGTSNCAASPEAAAAIHVQQSFIANNLAPLSKEMAQGQGETLVAFTETLGCDAAVAVVAQAQLQKSHGKIFAAPGAIAVLESAKAELRTLPDVASKCTWIAI